MHLREVLQTKRRRTVGTVVDSDNYDILSDSQRTTIVVLETASAKLKITLVLSMS